MDASGPIIISYEAFNLANAKPTIVPRCIWVESTRILNGSGLFVDSHLGQNSPMARPYEGTMDGVDGRFLNEPL